MILDVARRRAELTPDSAAVFFSGHWYTYAQLNGRANRLANLLASMGVRKGDRVSILASNHVAHIDLILATAKLGFIYTPLNTRLALPEQTALGAYLRPALVVHDDAHASGAAAVCDGAVAATQARSGATTGEGTAAPIGVCLDLGQYETRLAEASAEPLPDPDLDPEDTQMILLTGGTTGLPKGAMLPYRQGFYNAVNTVLSWGITQDDCVVQATPAFHAAINAFAVPLLHMGGRIVMQPSFEPGEYLKLIQQHDVSVLFLVPTMFHMLAEHPDFAGADLSSVRWAISGGAACPEPVRNAYASRGVRFKQGYGLSEAGVNCFSITLDQADHRPQSVGKPMLHAQAVVRRPNGEQCEPGEVGELTLAGQHVFSGYFERPSETAETLKDGWLWTGDLAVVDEDGFFAIVGRRKEMFVSGGENVFPNEIESVIYDHPAVAECAVLGVPDPRWGEVGLAAVRLQPGASTEPEQLREFLKIRLANYKVPKIIQIVNLLPKSGAGKILKTELASQWSATQNSAAAQPGAVDQNQATSQNGAAAQQRAATQDKSDAPQVSADGAGT